MTDKGNDQDLKCVKHNKPYVFYCDEESCKCFLCMNCLNEGNHENHKIYGMGLLKELPLKNLIGSRADKLQELIEKLKENEKEIKSCKETCEKYEEDLEKIDSTAIGKCLLSKGGKSKIQLVETTGRIIDTLKTHGENIKKLITEAEKDCSSLNLMKIIQENKTVDENLLEKAIDEIGSPVMREGNDLLEEISHSKFPEQLERFRDGISEPATVSGKRKKQEIEEEIKEEEDMKKKPKKGKKNAKEPEPEPEKEPEKAEEEKNEDEKEPEKVAKKGKKEKKEKKEKPEKKEKKEKPGKKKKIEKSEEKEGEEENNS